MYRNSQKRILEPEEIYFITTNTLERFPYFRNTIFCELFIEELKLCKAAKKFELYAFCVLYDHIHLLLKPSEEENLSKVMQFIKRHFGRSVNYVLGLNEGDIRECRLRESKYNALQNMIDKHDLLIKNFKTQFYTLPASHRLEIPEFKWQKSFHDHIIRDEKDFEYHWNYTSYNFDKHHEDGYPENYLYTSLNYEEMVDSVEF